MTIVEALAAGVPVLSTDVGIAREAGAIIAGGDYSAALIGWLSGLHERGVLKLQPYMSEETYFSQVRECYEAMVREARR
jgi:glycosyltransferase involved in cell wall biosynthesis